MTAPLPGSWRLGWAPGSRRFRDLIVGGHPTQIARLASVTAAAVDRLLDGATVAEASKATGGEAGGLARRLIVEGFAWADPAAGGVDKPGAEQVTVVVPARNAVAELQDLLRDPGAPAWIVVDDGSTDATARIAAHLGAQVVSHAESLGPAAARNTGWRLATTPFVLFADADAGLPAHWEEAMAHFADPAVAAVVPRVGPSHSGSPLSLGAAYEAARFAYDLGDQAGDVGPGRRLSYATTVAMFVRTHALAEVGGFAEDLRYGEDLDLVQRLTAAGWTIRYEPRCVASHATRTRLRDVFRLHHRYGTPLAELTRRRGRGDGLGTTSVAAAASVVLALVGRPTRGAALFAAGTVVRAATLSLGSGAQGDEQDSVPVSLGVSVAGRIELQSLRTTAAAVTGPWLPAAAFVARRSRRGLAVLAAAVVGRHLAEWRRLRPAIDPASWVALRVADDVSTATGIWRGCVRAHTIAPLLPRIRHLDVGVPTWEDR